MITCERANILIIYLKMMIVQTIYPTHCWCWESVKISIWDEIVQNSAIVPVRQRIVQYYSLLRMGISQTHLRAHGLPWNNIHLYNLVNVENAHHVAASQLSTSENPHTGLATAGSHFLTVFKFFHMSRLSCCKASVIRISLFPKFETFTGCVGMRAHH